MTRVCILTPVRERAWVLPTFFHGVDSQRSDDLEIDYAFFYEGTGLGNDDGTYELLQKEGRRGDYQAAVLTNENWHSPRDADDIIQHRWRCKFYRHMAKMRNALAEWAQVQRPAYDFLFALDSDIILGEIEGWACPTHGWNPHSKQRRCGVADCKADELEPYRRSKLAQLLDGLGPHDVIGPLVNLDPVPMCVAWNFMRWMDPRYPPGWAERDWTVLDRTGRHDVDVIMAAFLIPTTEPCPRWMETAQGEDIGWPWNAREAGLRCVVDTDVILRHIMRRRDLPDPRAK